MRSAVDYISVLAASLFITACSSMQGFPDRAGDVDERLKQLAQNYFLPHADVLANYRELTSASARRAYRDDVVYGRMMAVDLQFSIFSEAIYEEGIATNLTLDILGIGVGVAGAAVTAAEGSRILSALSGGISGTSTSINKNLYYERTMPALMALMEAERDQIRAEIFGGLLQEDQTYSLGQALIDLERYYLSGSIPGALSSVTQQAGATKEAADAAMSTARDAAFVDVAAQSRVNSSLDLVSSLPPGAAWEILQAPPSELDSFVASAVRGRLGGTALADAGGLLGGAANDANAKEVLRMVLVLLQDRSEESFDKWNAAIAAKSS